MLTYVAQLLMRDHWRDRGMLGKERVGQKERSREDTRGPIEHGGHKHGQKSHIKNLASLTRKKVKEHTRHRTRTRRKE